MVHQVIIVIIRFNSFQRATVKNIMKRGYTVIHICIHVIKGQHYSDRLPVFSHGTSTVLFLLNNNLVLVYITFQGVGIILGISH